MPPKTVSRRRVGRKLLVASLGVAAVNYVACSSSSTTGTNEPDGSTIDSGADQFVSGNLMGQPSDAKQDNAAEDAPLEALVANLVPPPVDAGDDGDAGD
jgi:hypothetical protein